MYLGTLESDFARSVGVLVAFGVVMFAMQGIVFPQASYYGQILLIGYDLLQVMQVAGVIGGMAALISIWSDIKWLQRVSFAFICWFYMTFVFVLVWMVGLQAPSVVFCLMTALISGAVYGYLTQKGKNNENINRSSGRKNQVRKGIPGDHSSTRIDKG